MNNCIKCNSTHIKILRHYQYYDIYECQSCEYWTYKPIEDCCRNPSEIIVNEQLDYPKHRIFYQCINCGDANRSKCLKSSKYGEDIRCEFDIASFDKRLFDKDDEQRFIRQQIEYYKNSIAYKYHRYLLSDQWKELRLHIFERDNNICQHCKLNPAEEVHHLTYNSIYKEPLSDLISVCRTCHQQIHKSSFFENDLGYVKQ